MMECHGLQSTRDTVIQSCMYGVSFSLALKVWLLSYMNKAIHWLYSSVWVVFAEGLGHSQCI
jgi:hypothetical protein